ncbi:MAG: hypothetical protein KME54_01030 [Tolypothrix brevis GSE-NOS-MK-07-07A]|nr:hypothetical protein [Tolypothrix brevis GSE-NOS-MK-07-07A]
MERLYQRGFWANRQFMLNDRISISHKYSWYRSALTPVSSLVRGEVFYAIVIISLDLV